MVLFLLWAAEACALELQADISSSTITDQQMVVFTLTLAGAEPTAEPEVTGLQAFFTIENTAVGRSSLWLDGQTVRAMRWQYQLKPSRTGKLTIPSLSVQTDKGRLVSRPVHLEVVAGTGTGQKPVTGSGEEAPDIILRTGVSNPAPYVGELVVHSISIYRGKNIVEAYLGKPVAGSSRIEPLGEPEVSHHQREDGPWMQSRFIFSLTPVQAGEVVIQPTAVEGNMLIRRLMGKKLNPFFDPAASPLEAMQGLLTANREPVPFSRKTEPLTLNVKPIPEEWKAKENQWLPVLHLAMTQQVVAQEAEVGQPLTRIVDIEMLGAYPAALPELTALLKEQLDPAVWQIYSAKPEIKTRYDPEYRTVKSHVRQHFTYVPLQPGAQALPEFRLPWWDVHGDRMAWASIPAANFQVKPGQRVQAQDAAPARKKEKGSSGLFIVFLMVAMAALASSWVMMRHRTRLPQWWKGAVVARAQAKPQPWRTGVEKKISPRVRAEQELYKATTPEALGKAVELYSRVLFRFKRDQRLTERAEALGEALSVTEGYELMQLCKELEQALYGNKGGLESVRWKKRFMELAGKAEKQWPRRASGEKSDPFSHLNP